MEVLNKMNDIDKVFFFLGGGGGGGGRLSRFMVERGSKGKVVEGERRP